MKYNTINRFVRLRSPEGEQGSSAGAPDVITAQPGVAATDGLSARLAAFAAQNAPDGIPVEPDYGQPEPVSSSQATPSAPVKDGTAAQEVPVDEQPFPTTGGDEPVVEAPASFDAAAYDAQTAQELVGMDSKAGAKWSSLRTEVKESRLKAAEMEARLAAGVVPDTVAAELAELRIAKLEVDGLRQRNEDLVKAGDVSMVVHGDAYNKQVNIPLNAIETIVDQMVNEINSQSYLRNGAKIDRQDLLGIVSNGNRSVQDSDIADFKSAHTNEVTGTRNMNRLIKFADDYREAIGRRDALVSNAHATATADRQQNSAQTTQQLEAYRTEFQSLSTKYFTDHAMKVPGFTDSLGQLTETAKAAMQVAISTNTSKLSPRDLSNMACAAQMIPAMQKNLVELRKENAMLKAGRSNNAPLSGSPTQQIVPDSDGKHMGLSERMKGRTFTFNG